MGEGEGGGGGGAIRTKHSMDSERTSRGTAGRKNSVELNKEQRDRAATALRGARTNDKNIYMMR